MHHTSSQVCSAPLNAPTHKHRHIHIPHPLWCDPQSEASSGFSIHKGHKGVVDNYRGVQGVIAPWQGCVMRNFFGLHSGFSASLSGSLGII